MQYPSWKLVTSCIKTRSVGHQHGTFEGLPYTIQLSEQDIPGASLSGRPPAQLKVKELRFWLKCRGDSGKGLKTKAQLVRR